jgi:hypothetical protein
MPRYKHYDYGQRKFLAVSFEQQILPSTFEHTLHRLIGVQINLFVFDAAPQPRDEHIVDPASFAIHANADGIGLESFSEHFGGELTALSVLNISGLPKRLMASCSASTQNSLAIVFEVRHAITLRLYRSRMATK